MKIITWLLLIVLFFIVGIFCNDALFAKFHQHGYKIRDCRLDLVNYSTKFFYFNEVKTFKFNRTTPAYNMTFRMKIATKDKLEVVVQVKKFLSNEYRHFPIRFQVNLRKVFLANVAGLGSVTKCGNVNYYYEKDVTYHACNIVADETHLPPLIPNGRFRVDLQQIYFDEEVALMYFYAEIYTPIPIPKK